MMLRPNKHLFILVVLSKHSYTPSKSLSTLYISPSHLTQALTSKQAGLTLTQKKASVFLLSILHRQTIFQNVHIQTAYILRAIPVVYYSVYIRKLQSLDYSSVLTNKESRVLPRPGPNADSGMTNYASVEYMKNFHDIFWSVREIIKYVKIYTRPYANFLFLYTQDLKYCANLSKGTAWRKKIIMLRWK